LIVLRNQKPYSNDCYNFCAHEKEWNAKLR
jgi:hypothetical protein